MLSDFDSGLLLSVLIYHILAPILTCNFKRLMIVTAKSSLDLLYFSELTSGALGALVLYERILMF